MHSTASTMMRRTAVTFRMRSAIDSGRATSPTAPMSVRSITRSGRRGGSMRTTRCASAILRRRPDRGLYLGGEEQIVDASVQFLERTRPDVAEVQVIAVQLPLHAAGMRREHHDAAAAQD